MKIGIIGAGKTGAAFALALHGRGAEIIGVYSRTAHSVEFISGRLGKAFVNDILQTVREADIVLLAVPDSVITDCAVNINNTCAAADIKGRIFLHCSGALTSAALEPLAESGGFTGSLHPVQTFANKEDGWKGMYGIYFGYEGMPEAREKAEYLVKALDGALLNLKPEAKPLYHAAACILSNYTVALSHVAGMLLDTAGIGKELGTRAFMPLLRNTVENIAAEGSLNALTGPVSRGDIITVAGHLNAMRDRNDGIPELYRVLGRITVGLAIEKGSIDEARAKLLLEALG